MFGLEKLFNRPPTRDAFAKLAIAHLKQKLPTVEFSYNEEQFALREANGITVYLVNYFDNYVKADKPGRSELLARLVSSAQEPPLPADLEEARRDLLPVLRNLPGLECALIDSGKTSLSAETATMGMRPFVADLGVGVAYDTATLVIQVGAPQCAKWGISPDEAHAIALDNLRHKAPPSFRQVIPGTYVAAYGDHYDATRILLPELAWQLQLSGNPVAMVPTRDCLLITGENDETGQSLMLAMAQTAIDETTRHLSPEMYRLVGSQWTSWQPVGACAAEHRKLVLMFWNGYYETQKTSLDQANALNQKDVFVASYKAMQKADGELFTFAALTHRLPTFLPEVELVALMDAEASQDSPPVVVPWKVFHDELGAQLERLEYVLPRYSANFDPSAEVMERLRQQAVSLG